MKKSTSKIIRLFRKTLAVACSSMLASSAFALSPLPYPLWTVEGGKLLDPNGNPFVFRGVTIDHARAPEKTIQSLKDIAALGANSAQIELPLKPVWVSGEFPRKIALEIRDIIKACKDNKLVCVLEANDVGGYSQAAGSINPSAIADFWGISDIRDVLHGSQSHIIIGFSNQIFDSHYTSSDYDVRMNTYVWQLKNALPTGFLLMIDGNKWGQDTDNAMLQFAQKNKNSNSYLASNLIYSIDMFDAYTDPVKVRDYIASFAQVGAPLIVGGFAPTPYYHPHNIAPRPTVVLNLPAQSVMQYAEQYGAGYFGWSWSGNQNAALDVVNNWDINSLTQWGNLLFNDPNGIKATAKTASIFSSSSNSSISSSNSSSSSSTDTNNLPVAVITFFKQYTGGCGSTIYGNASASESYDPDGDLLTYQWEITGYQSPISATGPSVRFSMQPPHYYTIKLTVDDGKGGTATTSIVRNDSTSDYCISSSSSSYSSTPIIRSSSSSAPSSLSSSSIGSSSKSSSSLSSSSAPVLGNCTYVINSQWDNGFTAVIRIKNTGVQPINGWNVNWQYGDGSKVTNLWNASLTGSNPYNANNLTWNSTIQPGQTVEFGFQGSKSAGAANVPVVTGSVCQ